MTSRSSTLFLNYEHFDTLDCFAHIYFESFSGRVTKYEVARRPWCEEA